ncbi:MAG: peptidylprolyl isomerase [Acidimicrobiales bacterium]|nr:MAG: peptidylprolyl isomerase [Acidimicrobiales bacterium]
MPSKDRQREMARKKLERRMALRAASARRRRRIYAGIGAGVTLIALLTVTIVLVINSGDDQSHTAISPTCAYLDARAGKDHIKDVGKPSTAHVPDAGIANVAVKTNFGQLDLALDRAVAPCSVNSFVHLVKQGFYDNTHCHRLTTSVLFVLQCGDPFGDSLGGPSYQFGVENTPTNDHPPYPVVSVAMARDPKDPNSNASQFFIVYKDSPELTAEYSLIGKVTGGLDVITDKIVPGGIKNEKMPGSGDGEPAKEVKISQAQLK